MADETFPIPLNIPWKLAACYTVGPDGSLLVESYKVVTPTPTSRPLPTTPTEGVGADESGASFYSYDSYSLLAKGG